MSEVTAPLNPFWMLQALGFQTPERLREENESLKQIITFQDTRIAALTKLIDLSAVSTLLTENADLHRLLGLRGEVISLEQNIEDGRKEG